MPPEYAEWLLMNRLHMSYTELEKQPAEWVELAFLFMQREAQYRKTLEGGK